LLAQDDHRLVIDLRIKLKESLDELAIQQFQASEAASELERCRTSRAELQLALEEEKQKIVRMRLANDELIAELRQCRARAEKQADYIQKKVRYLLAFARERLSLGLTPCSGSNLASSAGQVRRQQQGHCGGWWKPRLSRPE
jgi:hypothetical protein